MVCCVHFVGGPDRHLYIGCELSFCPLSIHLQCLLPEFTAVSLGNPQSRRVACLRSTGDQQNSGVWLQLALTQGKEIHWTEYGVGGGTCHTGNCLAEVGQPPCLLRCHTSDIWAQPVEPTFASQHEQTSHDSKHYAEPLRPFLHSLVLLSVLLIMHVKQQCSSRPGKSQSSNRSRAESCWS